MTEHAPEKVADLIARASGRVRAHAEFSRRMGGHGLRLTKLYEEHAELAAALEAVSAEVERLNAAMGRGFIEVLADRDEAYREMHARELHHFEEEQARAKAEAERDQALGEADRMQAAALLASEEQERLADALEEARVQKDWERLYDQQSDNLSRVILERDEALSVIADIRKLWGPGVEYDYEGNDLIELALSRVPERPKED